jgi:hypothetical protein
MIDADETTVELRLCANSNWNKPSAGLISWRKTRQTKT